MDVDDNSVRLGASECPSHHVDLGDLLQIAYNDPQMTIEEDFGLGRNYATSHKRMLSVDTTISGNEGTAVPSPNLQPPSTVNGETPPAVAALHSAPLPDNLSSRPKQSAKNRKRAEKRQKHAAEDTPLDRAASDRTRREHIQLAFPAEVNSAYTVNDMPAMKGAYKAQNEDNDPEAKTRFRSLEHFMKVHPDFDYLEWNGKEAKPIEDRSKKIGAVLCGQPDNPGYREAANEMLKVMLEATDATSFRKKESTHRRGRFPALNIGVTYGIGHQEPKFLETEPHTDMLQSILNNKYVQRIARFGDSAFQLWQPKVYHYYAERLEKLWARRPDLKRIFGKRSIYPCAAFNFARNVCCYKHRDVMNCPFGFCSITALGNFDATKGGHLILWEFKLVIEFPHGSTILVPSATITHSNIPVQDGDVRLSFTQFCAGGLFQYVDNGFSTEVDIKASDLTKYKEIQEKKPLNWKAGLDLIATMDDVKFN